MKRASIVLFCVVAVYGSVVQAQWFKHRDAATPRTADGKPNLSAPAPRINGKPDFSGLWQTPRTPIAEFAKALPPEMLNVQPDFYDVTKHFINVFWDISPAEWPLRPEGAAIADQRQKSGRDFQGAYCLPGSIPAMLFVMNFKIIQAPREIVMIGGNGDPARQIYLDGRGLPKDPQPSWMGSSVGRWEGDTLVIETTGFNERAWLDGFGHPRSESMRITERYRRRDFGHMDLEMTFEDAKYYTKPFTIKTAVNLVPDDDVLEYVCTENEKDNLRTAR